MKKGLEDILEGVRLACWSGDSAPFRDVLFAGIASRCGYYLRDIAAHLEDHDAGFLVGMFEKKFILAEADHREYLHFREIGEPVPPSPASALYRKYILVNNYLVILSSVRNASRRRKCAH